MNRRLGIARERWPRTLALLVAGALVASTCASESDRPLALQTGGEIDDPDVVYVYDGHGRLQAVTDPAGDTAVYARDAAGNVTRIDRYGSGEPSIIEVTPRRAARGDEVTVHGTGLGEDRDGHRGGNGSTVTIGGVEAEVANGSPFSLTVVVPQDVPAGDAAVEVETPDGPAATDITLAVTEYGAPVITGFSPAVAAPGGQVTVEGHGFADDPLLDAVVLGGATYARVTSASPSELVVELPATATTGRLSVATPDGTGRSDDELFVVPAAADETDLDAVALTKRTELGDSVAVNLDDDEQAVVAFDGRRGSHVGVEIELGEDEDACGVSFGVFAPGGGVLLDPEDQVLQTRSLCEDDRVPPVGGPLPVDGTYTLVIDAGAGVEGLDVSVDEVPAPDPGESDQRPRSDDGESSDSQGSDEGDRRDPGSGRDPDHTDADTGGGSSGGDPGEGETAGDEETADEDPDEAAAELPARPEVVAVEPPEGADALAPPDSPLAGHVQFPVDLASGVLATHTTDMVIADTMPLVLSRSYALSPGGGEWAFGKGSALEYDIDLRMGYSHRLADLELAAGVSVPFDRTTDGYDVESAVFEATTAPSIFGGARLSWGGIGWNLRLADGITLVFHGERGGRLQAVRDANGNQVTIQRERDQLGRETDTISSLTSPSGRTIRFRWHDRRLAEATDDLERTVTYTYDERDRLASVQLPGGGELGYHYDDDDRLATITGPGGSTIVANEYDDDARVVRQVGSDGLAHTFSYVVDDRDRVIETTVTDPAGGVRTVRFEAGWWVNDTIAAGTPVEATVGVERDPDTRLVTAHVDATGVRTVYDYDELGFPISVTAAAGTPDEATTTFAYESDHHRLAEITDPVGRTTTYSYDRDGNLTTVVAPGGRATTFDLDRRGRVRSVTDPAGATTEFDHELDHRVTITDATGVEVSEFSDVLGRPAVRTDGHGNQTRLRYDDGDQIVAVDAPPVGAVAEPVTTSATYDAWGRLATLTDPSGATTSVERDGAGRVVARVDPLGARDSYAYDAVGNLVGYTDRRGVASTFAYDALGRQVRADYGVGVGGQAESTISYAYDLASRRVVVDDSAHGTVKLTTDALGRLISETGPGGTVAYGYDAAGQRTSLTVDGDTETTYAYDDAGALASVASTAGAGVAVERDDGGRTVGAALPNDVEAAYGYDDAGRLAAIRYESGDQSLGGIRYGYDRNGRRIAAAGRLVDVALPDPVTDTAHDAANRLTSWNGAPLVWDAAGNMVDDGTRTYTWDARGQLASVAGPVTASFAYDPFGRRVARTVDGVTTVSVHDGLEVARQQTGDDKPVDYLGGLAIDDTLARLGSDGTTTYLTDGLGSTAALVDEGGTIATRYSRDPFGTTTVEGDDDPNPFGFTGRELDETGLMQYRARYYAPELGRFISEDPLGAAGGDTNLYTYAGGDPINVTDPSGACLEPATELLVQTFALVDYLLAVMSAERDGALTREESAAESDWVIRQNNANMDWFLAMCGAEAAFAGLGAITGGLGTRLPGTGRLAPRAGPGGGTTRVYRVEGPGNARLNIGPEGSVAIKGDSTLFLNFGDEVRAQGFHTRRISQGFADTQIKSFDVPTSYVDSLRASAVPESMARRMPDQPFSVDVNHAADQFGLRACQFPGLIAAIVPGSGQVEC